MRRHNSMHADHSFSMTDIAWKSILKYDGGDPQDSTLFLDLEGAYPS